MLGLTSLGVVHTAISLVAVASGFTAVIRDHVITPRNLVGKVYLVSTALTCLTGFGIFQHGGFNKAHVLGIITLVVLAIAGWAGSAGKPLGRASAYVETLGYSLTLFFHIIPGFTETATRLPVGAPLAANDQAPGLQAAIGGAFLVFVGFAIYQARAIHARVRATAAA